MVYRVDLPSGWIAGTSLELALGQQSGPLRSEESAVCFSVPANGAVMVDAGVRLLSLANQLDHIGKRVTLEFCREDTSTYDYLNRIGFFDGLRPNVIVRPERPTYSAASRYQGANSRLVEIAPLCPGSLDKSLPTRLEKALVSSIRPGARRELIGAAAFDLFSELVGNVYEHSSSQLTGFAVLQVYKNGNSARIAVSDSGDGLLETLRPSLPMYYPRLVGLGPAELLMHAFRDGLSRHGKGHGAGLKRCADHAIKLGANLEVRLPVNSVRLVAKRGTLRTTDSAQVQNNMPLISGTHIVFDFRLD